MFCLQWLFFGLFSSVIKLTESSAQCLFPAVTAPLVTNHGIGQENKHNTTQHHTMTTGAGTKHSVRTQRARRGQNSRGCWRQEHRKWHCAAAASLVYCSNMKAKHVAGLFLWEKNCFCFCSHTHFHCSSGTKVMFPF